MGVGSRLTHLLLSLYLRMGKRIEFGIRKSGHNDPPTGTREDWSLRQFRKDSSSPQMHRSGMFQSPPYVTPFREFKIAAAHIVSSNRVYPTACFPVYNEHLTGYEYAIVSDTPVLIVSVKYPLEISFRFVLVICPVVMSTHSKT